MQSALWAVDPSYGGGFSLGLMPPTALKIFNWTGVDWTLAVIGPRLVVFLSAVGVALIAALPFDRFDPSRERRARAARSAAEMSADAATAEAAAVLSLAAGDLTPAVRRFNPIGLWLAELRLMLKGLPWWWYLVAMGLIVGGVAAPLPASQQIWLPLAWLWPILIWSPMGGREARFGTGQLIFPAPRILLRQLAALMLAGVSVAAVLGAGTAARLVLAGQLNGLLAWGAGVLFIPSLALALGVWSGGSKLFEVVYVLLWYAGPISGATALDFAGATGSNSPVVFLVLAGLLLVAAAVGRRVRPEGA